jgi:hypothetical protein
MEWLRLRRLEMIRPGGQVEGSHHEDEFLAGPVPDHGRNPVPEDVAPGGEEQDRHDGEEAQAGDACREGVGGRPSGKLHRFLLVWVVIPLIVLRLPSGSDRPQFAHRSSLE